MPATQPEQRFFGLDLTRLQRDLAQAWGALRSSPALHWLSPLQDIRLLAADGSESLWQARAGAPQAAAAGSARRLRAAHFIAVQLPEDRLLRRSLQLPPMPAAALSDAVALELRSSSPFATDDLVWGYGAHPGAAGAAGGAAGKGWQVEVVLASARQVGSCLSGLHERLRSAAGGQPGALPQPEVWALAPGARAPVVLRGFGQTVRQRALARQRRTACALLGCGAALLLLIAITPTLQLRARAIEAVQSFDELSRRSAPLLQQREALLARDAQLQALQTLLAARVDPLRAMELLTQLLPDDTSLSGLQIQGNRVVLNGQTGNAAALMQQLSAQPALRDVRAPAAATRPPGAGKDIFNIELTLDAAALAAPHAAALQPAGAPPTPAAAAQTGAAKAGS